ncbi:alpha/beta hydrolase [Halorarius halobius]|uniref:alpha/beta hydrolase n=1 Tax=Halorarius halobius TaxID=2962671 RepID=UPI0020CDD727|nr:alpha/beta fold hydrolase [Halorarius halobius]
MSRDPETAREFARRFAASEAATATEAADLLSEAGRERVVDAYPEAFRDPPFDAEAAIEGYWWGLYGQYGPPEDVEVSVDGAEATATFAFGGATETATLELDDDGVAGVAFNPSYETPDYVDRDAITERDLSVDAGDVALDGRLAMPDGDGPFPGVVLVHGAGLHDPDGTAGTSKILKDLAWGFATEEIATLRYAKRLHDHEVPDESYTLDTVVTDDAVAAVEELADVAAVDADRLFVAGHSQGGMAAPRIAERHGGLAGVLLLDAPADPMVEPDDVAFMRYSFDPDGDLTDEQAEQLEQRRETFRRIASEEFEDSETLMGKPGIWHRSMHDCEPAETAAGLDAPAFVAKTGRADEARQPELVAFLEENVEAWRDVDLPAGGRVVFYETVDHYFQAGPTPTTMDALYFGGNVEPHVVADLVDWIRATGND